MISLYKFAVTGMLIGAVATCFSSYAADAKIQRSKAAPRKLKPGKSRGTTAAGARVYIDPVTGEMGAPPAEPSSSGAGVQAQSDPPVTVNADGSLTAVIPEDRMIFAVATVAPDGGLILSENSGQEAKKMVQPAQKERK